MRMIAILLLAAAPASAQGMWMQSAAVQPVGSHLATALYGALAALGYWVLRSAAKEGAAYVKRAGQAIAWFLIVIGLLGVLCGASMHVRDNLGCSSCDVQEWDEGYGEGMMPEEGGDQTIKVQVIKGGGK